MAEVRVKKLAQSASGGISKRELYATVAYHYPQYTLKEVAQLSGRDVALLLKVAQKEQASQMHSLTLIAQAPHSKKQENVKRLLNHFKKLAGK